MNWKRLLTISIAALAVGKIATQTRAKRKRPGATGKPSKLFRVVNGQVNKVPELKYLIDNEYFVVCPFLSTNAFIKHCKERGLQLTRDDLEQFERLGLFYPIARVEHPQSYFWFRNDHV